MNAFIYTVLAWNALLLACRLMLLATGRMPTVTPASLAGDCAFNVGFIVWAAVLRFGGA